MSASFWLGPTFPDYLPLATAAVSSNPDAIRHRLRAQPGAPDAPSPSAGRQHKAHRNRGRKPHSGGDEGPIRHWSPRWKRVPTDDKQRSRDGHLRPGDDDHWEDVRGRSKLAGGMARRPRSRKSWTRWGRVTSLAPRPAPSKSVTVTIALLSPLSLKNAPSRSNYRPS